MLYSAEMRVEMVESRMNALRKKNKRRMTFLLAMLCLLMTAGLAALAGPSVGGGRGSVSELYGSTLLSEDAGGYVLVGVSAFMAAVVITALCIRRREREAGGHDR